MTLFEALVLSALYLTPPILGMILIDVSCRLGEQYDTQDRVYLVVPVFNWLALIVVVNLFICDFAHRIPNLKPSIFRKEKS